MTEEENPIKWFHKMGTLAFLLSGLGGAFMFPIHDVSAFIILFGVSGSLGFLVGLLCWLSDVILN